MKRVELVVAYDGTGYCGWQLQPNGTTIEQVLNRALTELLREPIEVIGASRTDSGVHSLGTPCVFDTNTRIPADKICFALNEHLPEDIRIRESKEVPLDFHPRKQNSVKTYEYRIYNDRLPDPLHRLYSYFVYVPLDVEKMCEAASYLVGEYDFRSFCSSRTQVEDTVRTIYECSVREQASASGTGREITIRISGSGFLYNMVRIIAGTLVKVGMRVYPPEHVREILLARDRNCAGPKAPAQGLTLMSYVYEEKLAPTVHSENSFWDYDLAQGRIADEGIGGIRINRCDEEERDDLIRRLTLRMIRNKAEEITLEMPWDEGEHFQVGDFPYEREGSLYRTTAAAYRALYRGGQTEDETG